jgi:hypothetical protein
MNLTTEQETQLRNEIDLAERARKAKSLFVSSHIKSVRDNIYNQLSSIGINDKEKLEDVRNLLAAVNALEKSIEITIETGILAKQMLGESV